MGMIIDQPCKQVAVNNGNVNSLAKIK